MKNNNYQGKLQSPIGSGFNAKSTANDIINTVDLSGKVSIVTGGYAGIGLETVRVLASAGATVIVPARDLEKARKNLSGIENVEVCLMDLMNPDSIDLFATDFVKSGRPLHLLINNAGIMWVPLRRDSRGIESQLSTNHLGHFLLTARLWEALVKANGARVINVSSFGHQMAPFDFDDPNFLQRKYETLLGYGQSKTANNLFTVELDNRGKQHKVRAYAVHPGSVYGTDLPREASAEIFKQMGTFDENGIIRQEVLKKLKTIPQGAATTIWCATSNMLDDIGGVYCEDADIAELDTGNIVHEYNEPSTQRGVQVYSLDKSNARKLWELSEELIDIKFQIN